MSRYHLLFSLCVAAGIAPGFLSAAEPDTANAAGALPGFGPAPADSELEKLMNDPPVLGDDMLPKLDDASAPTPTENAVVNLIQMLVQKGVLTKAEAASMVAQAEREAAVARETAAAAALVAADADMASSGDMVVTHIPDPVKQRMQEEIKADLLQQVKSGQIALPGRMIDERFKFAGDIRVRYAGSFFPEGNDTSGAFPDFNAINTGAPFDVAGTDFSPQLNVDEERNSMQLRARFGVEAMLDDGFSVGLRVATGNDNNPVSTNQRLGGNGGNFSKYSLWLDRAYLRWELLPPTIDEPVPGLDGKAQVAQMPRGRDIDGALSLSVGRFDNPFFSPDEMMWDSDLGFDGLSLQARREVVPGVTPWINAGAFPIFNSSFNFATNNPDKFESTDKWLFGLQGGIEFRREKQFTAKFGAAFHDFKGVEGELSDPYLPLSTSDAGNTDSTRPSFAQRGNTYMALRNIIPDPLNDFGTSKQYQYYGLASRFQVLSYNGKVDLNFFEPVQVSLWGQYAVNLAHDPFDIETKAVNNRGPVAEGESYGKYDGGDTAWSAGIQLGDSKFTEAGDWNISLGYRHVESDALVDAFVDSDFLGGTNSEGFIVRGGVAVSPNVFFGLRWVSGNEISGPPMKSDLILFDINASF